MSLKMKRILLRIAYDGTGYVGWQKQNNGLSVEEVINNALKKLTGEDIAVTGASRTDSGVHALDNVAVFDTASPIPGDKFSYALNRYLPGDIKVQSSTEVSDGFHPRYAVCRKIYEYSIYNAGQPNPLYDRFSSFVHYDLDVEAMNTAAGYLEGEHDFAAFCSAGAQVRTTVRSIYAAQCFVRSSYSVPAAAGENTGGALRECDDVCRETDRMRSEAGAGCCETDRMFLEAGAKPDSSRMIVIRLTGNGFLYNMVRIIAGTLLQVGQGIYPPEHVKEILDSRDRAQAGPTAPPQGLVLKEINYQDMESIRNYGRDQDQ